MSAPHHREEELFLAAIRLNGAARKAFLDGACLGDSALRQRLEELLAEQNASEKTALLSAPLVNATIKLDFPEASDEAVGQTLGRYKLMERLGEGGFGVVYVAEQTRPVRRRVALKVIKFGMDTKAVVARFEAERQALALMDHPNIAKVLDGGATERGRPYFVMELVRGIKITDYCDQNSLTTKERLDLFIKVCQAIQHAHQKGIIHRDIKPSNIMVTLHDGVPVPKVIDFGIAKATEGRLTDATVYTQLHQFMGTPAYMSPEQAEMSGLDIDTRSDIYSLGVLLYELLAGSTPFDSGELMSQGIDRMRKKIREEEPPRPSTRFATLVETELTTTAKRRSTDTARLMHELKGDLDWIVMKCLEKDRTRRYETANGLAADITRHLNDEPVIARPPSAVYKFQKAFRRHKLVFTAGFAIAATLLLGIILATWQSMRATQAKREAQAAQANETLDRLKAEASEQKALAAQANEARLRKQAEADELAARQRAYAADMNIANLALEQNNFGRALDLLNLQRPGPGQKDLRGWEWRYLWQQTRSDASSTLTREPSEIQSLAVSPDGQWLAIGEHGGNGLSLWNLPTRKEVNRMAENEADVHVAFSGDGTLLAYTSLVITNGESQYALHFWNLAARQMQAVIPLGADYCNGLAFSADGQRLAASIFYGLTNQITIWSVSGTNQLASYPTRGVAVGPMPTSFATTPSLDKAAFSTLDYRVGVIDLQSGRELWSAPVNSGFECASAFSPDGKILATAEGFNESKIRLWDADSGKEIGQLAGHGAWVNSLAFWPDGKTLASGSADQTIRVWDLASRTCRDVLRGHRFGVWRVALSPDGKTLLSGCKDGTVFQWDPSISHLHQPRITIQDTAVNWCFAKAGESVLTFNRQGQVTRWTGANFQRSEPVIDFGTNYEPYFYFSPLFSPDGRFLATGSDKGITRVWDLAQRSWVRQITNTTGEVRPKKFLDSGRKLLTESIIGRAGHIWDLAAGRELQSWAQPDAPYSNIAGTSDENLFVNFEDNGLLHSRDLATGHSTETNLNFLGVYSAAFSPNGQWFAVASTYGYARVWDTALWRELATLGGFLSGVNSAAFSPDASRLATGSGKQQALSLWDTESWQNVLTLEGQGAGFSNTQFSPDGGAVGSLNVDGNLQIWCAPSWAEINAAEAQDKAEGRQP